MTETRRPVLDRIREQALADNVRVTRHAQQEMVEEDISLHDVLEAVSHGTVLEDYARHRRGACCLVYGRTRAGRPIHVVCTTAQPTLVIITVYEPKAPKWTAPTQRRPQSP
ncbi:MAG: DUF4258 domain-containing protein [Candidatus Tectomicrobia bacterium]|nr:DUF4258 domain-containing protein [Candidatus Tectomicrobia bacterium]